MVNLRDAHAKTPAPSLQWRQLSDAERLTRVMAALRTGTTALNGFVAIAAAKQDGQIIVNLVEPMPASKRGPLLLDLEAYLKMAIDPSLVVWLEPLGDRNSLRNLRGIEVRA
jgi:hypothetical protein